MSTRVRFPHAVSAGQERGAVKPAVSPFGGAAKAAKPAVQANPFGSSSSISPRPFKEPDGMSPDMQQYPISEEPWWKQITVVQLVRPFHHHNCELLNSCTLYYNIIIFQI